MKWMYCVVVLSAALLVGCGSSKANKPAEGQAFSRNLPQGVAYDSTGRAYRNVQFGSVGFKGSGMSSDRSRIPGSSFRPVGVPSGFSPRPVTSTGKWVGPQ